MGWFELLLFLLRPNYYYSFPSSPPVKLFSTLILMTVLLPVLPNYSLTTFYLRRRDMQEDNRCNEDVTSPPPPPSLAKLLKTEAADNSGTAPSSRQQHFDSGGGVGLMDGEGQDSWGSISKMLHQRYNSSRSPGATGEKNRKRPPCVRDHCAI